MRQKIEEKDRIVENINEEINRQNEDAELRLFEKDVVIKNLKELLNREQEIRERNMDLGNVVSPSIRSVNQSFMI